MSEENKTDNDERWILFCLAIGCFLFYLWTLAPTVLWGDDAFFQTAAYLGELPLDGSYHWLWLQFAKLFAKLPFSDFAYRINLLSAVFATITIVLLYATAKLLGVSWRGALLTAVSLAVAHTFWMHAVRAEVYTIFTAVYVLELWLWFRWREDTLWPLLLGLILLGLLLLSHQMGILMLPAFFALIYWRRNWLSQKQWLYIIFSLFLGFAIFLLILSLTIARLTQSSLWVAFQLYFTQSGTDFSGSILDFSWALLPRDIFLFLGFWGLQFVGFAGLLGVAGVYAIWCKGWPVKWRTIIVLYGTAVLFAFSYHVNDQYVFYLPSFMAFTFFIGAGWDWIESKLVMKKWRKISFAIILSLLIIVPMVAYWSSTQILIQANLNPLGIRSLPGREPNSFFLWPGKNGYKGALEYGENLLENLPPNATVLADHTPASTLRYLQIVEKVRPDVVVVYIAPAGTDLAPILADIAPDTAVYLADNNPDYYNLTQIPNVLLTPDGLAYQLHRSE